MGAGLYSHTTRSSGLTLTANIYNSDHQNHIDNQNTQQTDDYSESIAQMQTVTDPYPGDAESQPTNLAGELERLRFLIKQISGEAQWYIDPDSNIATIVVDISTINTTLGTFKAIDDGNNIIANRMLS